MYTYVVYFFIYSLILILVQAYFCHIVTLYIGWVGGGVCCWSKDDIDEKYCEAYMNSMCDLCGCVGCERGHSVLIENPYRLPFSRHMRGQSNQEIGQSISTDQVKYCRHLQWIMCRVCYQRITLVLELWHFYDAMLRWKGWNLLFPPQVDTDLIKRNDHSNDQYVVNVGACAKEFEKERPMMSVLLALCLKDFEIRIREFSKKHTTVSLSSPLHPDDTVPL
ncbi:hypothetical protein RFI_06674 [Reticulomyxa filosa]|uniref:Uncharacterized protein n=1 Tax=Reticulomyxa filosa TaxID=46433 RepID=X6NWV1_RETFI|nr:hypothetical protein RFI_06674 [Reticulomyxa filosa]|eukprot:ETO30446.1 hypothetical protein RFI_06674 [Reticulomyxa filosa]